MYEMVEKMAPNAVIKVIGVGGGGGNAVSHMVGANVEGVDFVCANTDSQALKNSGAKFTLQLGANVTKGLGAGANPEVGRQAALEDRERITELLEGADMVFITAGMGGGTGTSCRTKSCSPCLVATSPCCRHSRAPTTCCSAPYRALPISSHARV